VGIARIPGIDARRFETQAEANGCAAGPAAPMKSGTGMTATPVTTVHTGSRNIFADLGLPDPERERLRAHLTLHIYRIVKERGLTEAQAGEILRVKPQHAAGLMRNRAGHFSVGQLS
jgi:hypothetical protein